MIRFKFLLNGVLVDFDKFYDYLLTITSLKCGFTKPTINYLFKNCFSDLLSFKIVLINYGLLKYQFEILHIRGVEK